MIIESYLQWLAESSDVCDESPKCCGKTGCSLQLGVAYAMYHLRLSIRIKAAVLGTADEC